ncbi:hypothetical protein [Mesorhizobium sanjuanii]|uniref:hypothetical protein n=1 Tax=Mesorhizobium sanjuanii TaxID=2037900 RepID=UPI001056868A|nr:hypothetical protein [Mesorhizobium sanjuanii]
MSLLADSGGALDRAEAAGWLNPGFTRDNQEVAEKPTAFQQVVGAASSLGAVEADGSMLRLSPGCDASTNAAFSDWVHDRLATLDSAEKDGVVLEAFAWLAAKSDAEGSVGWISQSTADGFADAAEQALPDAADDDGDRRINRTKLPSWRRWLISLGLIVSFPGALQWHPLIDRRVARELTRAGLRQNEEIPAVAFLSLLAKRLPYLDGGPMFVEATRRIKHAERPRQLSPILSAALRNLHDDGVIELKLLGDAADLIRLSQDTHRLQAFYAVVAKSLDVV